MWGGGASRQQMRHAVGPLMSPLGRVTYPPPMNIVTALHCAGFFLLTWLTVPLYPLVHASELNNASNANGSLAGGDVYVWSNWGILAGLFQDLSLTFSFLAIPRVGLSIGQVCGVACFAVSSSTVSFDLCAHPLPLPLPLPPPPP
jgi:hypothetical protein